tara:strand:- start:137 stop:529 length:393 start_codon:yes stop_codon:yes gene_type:complete
MARNNTLTASFTQADGDGASGYSESMTAAFTSGDSIKLEGNISHSAEVQYVLADYGVAQADGLYFENRDATNFISLSVRSGAGSGNNEASLKIAPLGCFMVRMDDTQTAITHIGIQADTAPCDFILCVSE